MIFENRLDVLLNKYKEPSQFTHHISISVGLIYFEPALRVFLEMFSNHFRNRSNYMV